jgi:NAD(P)-dependent dehydrogenase (short-subunit alcohol dehydrogenase family)
VHDPKRYTGMPKPRVTDVAALAVAEGDGRLAYVHSKLCNLWFAYELVRRIERAGIRGVTVNAFDPGLVPGSGLAREYPPALRFVWNRILPALARALTGVVPGINPAPKAGDALARLVLDPALAGVSGKYFPSHTRWREAPSSDASYDVAQAARLWDESVRMTGLAVTWANDRTPQFVT